MSNDVRVQVPSSAPGCKARKALNIKGFRAFSFSEKGEMFNFCSTALFFLPFSRFERQGVGDCFTRFGLGCTECMGVYIQSGGALAMPQRTGDGQNIRSAVFALRC